MDKGRTCNDCQYNRVCSTRRTCGDMAWVCRTYTHYIDRDALLELADEMEAMTKEAEPIGFVFTWRLEDFVRDFRKILGVNNDY